jgi:hypothetical protein
LPTTSEVKMLERNFSGNSLGKSINKTKTKKIVNQSKPLLID